MDVFITQSLVDLLVILLIYERNVEDRSTEVCIAVAEQSSAAEFSSYFAEREHSSLFINVPLTKLGKSKKLQKTVECRLLHDNYMILSCEFEWNAVHSILTA